MYYDAMITGYRDRRLGHSGHAPLSVLDPALSCRCMTGSICSNRSSIRFSSLSQEILQEILKQLTLQDISDLSLVSSHFS